jgi:Ca2+-binding EF-hand superfamily protein
MASASRRNKFLYKARATKSINAFAAFDQSQIQEFKEAFNLIDQDKDGIISSQDLKLMFEFDKSKILSVTSDEGSNMLRLFKARQVISTEADNNMEVNSEDHISDEEDDTEYDPNDDSSDSESSDDSDSDEDSGDSADEFEGLNY